MHRLGANRTVPTKGISILLRGSTGGFARGSTWIPPTRLLGEVLAKVLSEGGTEGLEGPHRTEAGSEGHDAAFSLGDSAAIEWRGERWKRIKSHWVGLV